jgi:hypothetical protein
MASGAEKTEGRGWWWGECDAGYVNHTGGVKRGVCVEQYLHDGVLAVEGGSAVAVWAVYVV